ncbi:MAG: hypothetical protein EKK45_03920 [Curvibacter sp.]|nr:MAG: hypothetical protein EKK45_03920 [Curvibacter sp.]
MSASPVESFNLVRNEIAALDKAINAATSERELNEIGVQVADLEQQLNVIHEVILLAAVLPSKIEERRDFVRRL